jgi:hypothetical protein
MERPEWIAVSASGPEINHGAIRELDFEVRLPGDLRASLRVDRDARLQVGIVLDLEFHFFNDGVNRALMRRGHQNGTAFSHERMMKSQRCDVDRFAGIAPVEMDDVCRRTFQVFILMRPIGAGQGIPHRSPAPEIRDEERTRTGWKRHRRR